MLIVMESSFGMKSLHLIKAIWNCFTMLCTLSAIDSVLYALKFVLVDKLFPLEQMKVLGALYWLVALVS